MDQADAVAFASDPRTALHALVLLVGGLALLPQCAVVVRRLTPRVPVFFARWRFLHLGLVLAAGIVAVVAVSQFLLLAFPKASELYLDMVASAAGLGAAGLAIVMVARRMDPEGVLSLGLWPGGHLRAALVGMLAYAFCAPALLGLMLLWPWLFESLGGEVQFQEAFGELAAQQGLALYVLLALVVIVQPLFEEVLFRGFVQPLFVQNLGDRGGVIVTSVFFAALHGLAFFLPIFALSLLLGALKLRTQRLAAPFAVHALHNGLMVALTLQGANAVGVETAGWLAPWLWGGWL